MDTPVNRVTRARMKPLAVCLGLALGVGSEPWRRPVQCAGFGLRLRGNRLSLRRRPRTSDASRVAFASDAGSCASRDEAAAWPGGGLSVDTNRKPTALSKTSLSINQ